MSIKGNPAGEAVLCTQAATFDLKAIETTNSILLVEAGVRPRGVGMTCDNLHALSKHPSACLQDSSRQQTGQEPVLVRATAGSHVDVVLAAPRLADLEATLQVKYLHLLPAVGCAVNPALPFHFSGGSMLMHAHASKARAIGREDDSMAVDGQEPAGVPFNDLLDLFQVPPAPVIQSEGAQHVCWQQRGCPECAETPRAHAWYDAWDACS